MNKETRSVKMHPLTNKRLPGPPSKTIDDRSASLKDAYRILELVEQGKLETTSLDPYKPSKKRLTAEDEAELALRIQRNGDIDARNQLVMANIGLIKVVVSNYFKINLHLSEDLFNEGVTGLIRACETFDPNRGLKFSTYCSFWIRAKVGRHLKKIDRVESHLEDITDVRSPRRRLLSLEAMSIPLGEESEGEETVAANQETPEELVSNNERALALRNVLKRACAEITTHTVVPSAEEGKPGTYKEIIDSRVRIVVDHRLLSSEPECLEQIGNRLGITREGARILEKKIIDYVKRHMVKFK